MKQSMNRKNPQKQPVKDTARKARIGAALACALALCVCLPTVCLADGGDPISVVNNLSTFVFGLIRAVGMILLGWGVVQIGLSLKSHDPSQRANAFLTIAGGIVITFAKEILDIIVG